MAVMIRLKQFHRDNTKEHNSQAIAGIGTQTTFTKATVKQAVFHRIVQKNGDLRPSLHASQHLHSNISLHTMSMTMSPSYANTYSRSLETKIVQKPLWSSLQGYKMFHTCSTQKAQGFTTFNWHLMDIAWDIIIITTTPTIKALPQLCGVQLHEFFLAIPVYPWPNPRMGYIFSYLSFYFHLCPLSPTPFPLENISFLAYSIYVLLTSHHLFSDVSHTYMTQ